MVAEIQSRLIPASYLTGASCLLPERLNGGSWLRGPTFPSIPTCGGQSPAPRSLGSVQRSAGTTRLTAGQLLTSLTPAERAVAALVCEGMSNKEISSALGRAEATIKHQLASALRKASLQSRCQLIVMLLRG